MKNIKVFLFALTFVSSIAVFAQRGIDLTPTISAANTIVNEYTALTADAAIGATTISVTASGLNANNRFGAGNTLAAGDLVMIIQMQGASSSSTFSNRHGFPNLIQFSKFFKNTEAPSFIFSILNPISFSSRFLIQFTAYN